MHSFPHNPPPRKRSFFDAWDIVIIGVAILAVGAFWAWIGLLWPTS